MPLREDHPDFIDIQGSLDDEETQELLLDMVKQVKPRVQIKVRVDEGFFYLCENDTIESIKKHRDYRHNRDRREKPNHRIFPERRQRDRRQEPPQIG